MMGAVIGSAIATTALLAVIWNRQGWARYVLLTLLWAVVGIFCIPAISLVSIMDEVPRSVVGALFGGIALYLVAILILTVSRPIQRLAKNDVG